MEETRRFFIMYYDSERARHSFNTHKLVSSVAEIRLLTNQYVWNWPFRTSRRCNLMKNVFLLKETSTSCCSV